MKAIITDDYPRKAVWYWGLCVGGHYDEIKVSVSEDGTSFQNKRGATLFFDYVLDFNDPKLYDGGIRKLNELCGFEIGGEE